MMEKSKMMGFLRGMVIFSTLTPFVSVSCSAPYERYLRRNEYIIPDAVFDEYIVTISGRENNSEFVIGGQFIDETFLENNEMVNEFKCRLKKLGYKTDDIVSYLENFIENGNIVLRYSVIEDQVFKEILFHERIHREIENLDVENHRKMEEAAIGIRKTVYSLEEAVDAGFSKHDIDALRTFGMESIYLLQERGQENALSSHFRNSVHRNWGEFYPYLATSKFIPLVEEVFKEEYSDAYEIYTDVIERARVGK